MIEIAARKVLLLQAVETLQPASTLWTDTDSNWATNAALASATGPSDLEAFCLRRAQHALPRLFTREPEMQVWLTRDPWTWAWTIGAALAGLATGLLVDGIGTGQRINLLAPPLWALLAWNLGVLAMLLIHALVSLRRPGRGAGRLVRHVQGLIRSAGSRSLDRRLPAANGDRSRILRAYLALWWRSAASLWTVRIELLLHIAAAALALGMIGGLYLRGLALDYRASWESTFLSADSVHSLLSKLLAPAAALSGIRVPSAAELALLRVAHGSGPVGAPGAPWIHLLALTLTVFVVVPRLLLALVAAVQAHRRARHFRLPVHEPYFSRLSLLRGDSEPRVGVFPYAKEVDAPTIDGLHALLAPAMGLRWHLRVAPLRPYGSDFSAEPDLLPPAETALAVALFDLSATPEFENHGRFAQELARTATTIIVVDEASFRQRFGADSPRLAEREQVWYAFAQSMGTVPLLVDLRNPEPDANLREVELILSSPVNPSST